MQVRMSSVYVDICSFSKLVMISINLHYSDDLTFIVLHCIKILFKK